MGYMQHHAIIVTGYDEESFAVLHAFARKCFGEKAVSSVVHANVNGYITFLVGPDGSKSGWEEDQDGDVRRAAFLATLESYNGNEYSCPVQWVEVQYADDDGDDRVVRTHRSTRLDVQPEAD